jgi:hypothetical protein
MSSSLNDDAAPSRAASVRGGGLLARALTALGRAVEQGVRDERGAAFTEALIAFPVILMGFLGLYQLSYLYAADLIVKRAASAAARAAMVFLADDERYYGGGGAPREAYVTEAARRVMLASPMLDPRTLRVAVSGDRAGFALLNAQVEVDFSCAVFLVGAFCGADNSVPLSAKATLPISRDAAAAP